MWYVLQVGVGNEANMKEFLENYLSQELVSQVFCPMYESSYKRGGIWQIVTRVLFPGYLFLEIAPSGEGEGAKELEKCLRGITEFQRLLSTGKACIPVSEAEQLFLTEHTDQRHVMTMSRGYMVGREVTITEGAFAGYQGQLKYVDRHNRYGVMSVKLGEREMDMQFGLEIVRKESA